MNWWRYLMSSLIAWGMLVGAGVIRDLVRHPGTWRSLVPIPLAFNLLLLVLLSFAFVPVFLLARRFMSQRVHASLYAVVGATGVLLIEILWRTLSGVPVAPSQYAIESTFAIAIGAIFGLGFAKAQRESEQTGAR